MSVEDEVRAAGAALVEDFGAGRVEEYFSRLAPDATFLFHTSPERLPSRDAYRALWDRWVREDGFLVLACTSSHVVVQPLGDDAAVLSHEVATRVSTNDGEEEVRERESIVFARRDGQWLVVHEHLSPNPEA
jgi:ketosteroid isomerase-like protein